MDTQLVVNNKKLVRKLCFVFITLTFLRYQFPILDNSLLGLTITDFVFFLIILSILGFHKNPFKAFNFKYTYIFILLYTLPITIQLIIYVYNYSFYGALVYFKLLFFPFLFNLIDFRYQNINYIQSLKNILNIFIYFLSIFLLFKIFSNSNFFYKTNFAPIPITCIGFILIQLADYLSLFIKSFKLPSFILTVLLLVWCISDFNRAGLIIFLVQILIKNFKLIKEIIIGKIKKFNLFILISLILIIIPFIGKIIDMSNSTTSFNTRIIGLYLMREKFLMQAFLVMD